MDLMTMFLWGVSAPFLAVLFGIWCVIVLAGTLWLAGGVLKGLDDWLK